MLNRFCNSSYVLIWVIREDGLVSTCDYHVLSCHPKLFQVHLIYSNSIGCFGLSQKSPILFLQQTVAERPATSKPRDPDSYDFKDEQLAKDYRKMYDKYQQMEEMMKDQSKEAKEQEGD